MENFDDIIQAEIINKLAKSILKQIQNDLSFLLHLMSDILYIIQSFYSTKENNALHFHENRFRTYNLDIQNIIEKAINP